MVKKGSVRFESLKAAILTIHLCKKKTLFEPFYRKMIDKAPKNTMRLLVHITVSTDIVTTTLNFLFHTNLVISSNNNFMHIFIVLHGCTHQNSNKQTLMTSISRPFTCGNRSQTNNTHFTLFNLIFERSNKQLI